MKKQETALRWLMRTAGRDKLYIGLLVLIQAALGGSTVLYALLLVFCVVTTYNAVNAAIIGVTGAKESLPLGVEPFCSERLPWPGICCSWGSSGWADAW